MYDITNQWKYNNRSLFTSNDGYKLPSWDWQVKTELVNAFNNDLVSAFKSNLTLYSPEEDLKLFNNLDLKPISTDNVNFDDINEKLKSNYSKNDDIYHNTRSVIAGVVDQVNKTSNDTIDNLKKEFNNLFNIDTSNLKIYIGLAFLFVIINR